MQPGCKLDLTMACSHSRSYELLSESIKSDKFVARKCKSLKDAKSGNCNGDKFILKGDLSSVDAEGIYWFKTNNKSPFGLG